ncbi:hypothetical protein [Actinoplanes rectilineatus]|uniref:hypothetical protein n=1 Tax=Actinoplanes rectilineatus TaxID=113571 RepID=UPI001B80766D|nr:hypothetical protein [Actinoplanes rectilineatus]
MHTDSRAIGVEIEGRRHQLITTGKLDYNDVLVKHVSGNVEIKVDGYYARDSEGNKIPGKVSIGEVVSAPAKVLPREDRPDRSEVMSLTREANRRLDGITPGEQKPLHDLFPASEGWQVTSEGERVEVLGRVLNPKSQPYTQYTVGVPIAGATKLMRYVAERSSRVATDNAPRSRRGIIEDGLDVAADVAARYRAWAGPDAKNLDAEEISGVIALMYPHVAALSYSHVADLADQDVRMVKSYLAVASRTAPRALHAGLSEKAREFLDENSSEVNDLINQKFGGTLAGDPAVVQVLKDNFLLDEDGTYDVTSGRVDILDGATIQDYLDNALLGEDSSVELDQSTFLETHFTKLDDNGGRLTDHPLVVVELRALAAHQDLDGVERSTEDLAALVAEINRDVPVADADRLTQQLDQVDGEIADGADALQSLRDDVATLAGPAPDWLTTAVDYADNPRIEGARLDDLADRTRRTWHTSARELDAARADGAVLDTVLQNARAQGADLNSPDVQRFVDLVAQHRLALRQAGNVAEDVQDDLRDVEKRMQDFEGVADRVKREMGMVARSASALRDLQPMIDEQADGAERLADRADSALATVRTAIADYRADPAKADRAVAGLRQAGTAAGQIESRIDAVRDAVGAAVGRRPGDVGDLVGRMEEAVEELEQRVEDATDSLDAAETGLAAAITRAGHGSRYLADARPVFEDAMAAAESLGYLDDSDSDSDSDPQDWADRSDDEDAFLGRPSPLGQGRIENGRTDPREPSRGPDTVPATTIDDLRSGVTPRRADTAAYDVVHTGTTVGPVPAMVAESYAAAGLDLPTTGAVARPALDAVTGPIAYDHRVLTTGDGRTVHDFTVKVFLDARDPAADQAKDQVGRRAKAAVAAVFNNGYRIGDGQFNVHVDFVTDPADAHTVIALHGPDDAPATTQTTWSTASDDLDFAHEIGHYLGLYDENVDRHLTDADGNPVQRILNRDAGSAHVFADNSIMTSADPADRPQVFQRHLDQIIRIRDTALSPDRGDLGPDPAPRVDRPGALGTRPAGGLETEGRRHELTSDGDIGYNDVLVKHVSGNVEVKVDGYYARDADGRKIPGKVSIGEVVTSKPFAMLGRENRPDRAEVVALHSDAVRRLDGLAEGEQKSLAEVFPADEGWVVTDAGKDVGVKGRILNPKSEPYTQYSVGVPVAGLTKLLKHVADNSSSIATDNAPRSRRGIIEDGLDVAADVTARYRAWAGPDANALDADEIAGVIAIMYPHVAALSHTYVSELAGQPIRMMKSYLAVASRIAPQALNASLSEKAREFLSDNADDINDLINQRFGGTLAGDPALQDLFRREGILDDDGRYDFSDGYLHNRGRTTIRDYLDNALLGEDADVELDQEIFLSTHFASLDDNNGRLADRPLVVVEIRALRSHQEIEGVQRSVEKLTDVINQINREIPTADADRLDDQLTRVAPAITEGADELTRLHEGVTELAGTYESLIDYAREGHASRYTAIRAGVADLPARATKLRNDFIARMDQVAAEGNQLLETARYARALEMDTRDPAVRRFFDLVDGHRQAYVLADRAFRGIQRDLDTVPREIKLADRAYADTRDRLIRSADFATKLVGVADTLAEHADVTRRLADRAGAAIDNARAAIDDYRADPAKSDRAVRGLRQTGMAAGQVRDRVDQARTALGDIAGGQRLRGDLGDVVDSLVTAIRSDKSRMHNTGNLLLDAETAFERADGNIRGTLQSLDDRLDGVAGTALGIAERLGFGPEAQARAAESDDDPIVLSDSDDDLLVDSDDEGDASAVGADPGRYRFAPDETTVETAPDETAAGTAPDETAAETAPEAQPMPAAQPQRVDAGILLAGPDDTATPRIAARFPANPERFHVFTHADSTSLRVGSDRVGPDRLAAMIRANPDWHGQPIVLVACDTAVDSANGFAARLARELPGTRIVAPRGIAFAGASGHVVVSNPDTYDEFGMPIVGEVTADSRWLSLVAGPDPDAAVQVTELGHVLSPSTALGEPDPDGLAAVIDEYTATTAADLGSFSPEAQRVVDRIGRVLPLAGNAQQWQETANALTGTAEAMSADVRTGIAELRQDPHAGDPAVQRSLTGAQRERTTIDGFRENAVQARHLTARTTAILDSLAEVHHDFDRVLSDGRRYAAQATEAARTAQQARRDLDATPADQPEQRAVLHRTMAEAFARSNFAAAHTREARDRAAELAAAFARGPLAGTPETITARLENTRAVVEDLVDQEAAAHRAFDRAAGRIEDAGDRLTDLNQPTPDPEPAPTTETDPTTAAETATDAETGPEAEETGDTPLPTADAIRANLPDYLRDSHTLGIAEQLLATEDLNLDAALRTLGTRLSSTIISRTQDDAVDDVDQFLSGRPIPVTIDGRPAELRVKGTFDWDAMTVVKVRDTPGKISSKVQETVTHSLKHNRDRRIDPKATVSAAPGLVVGVGGSVPVAPAVEHSTAHKSKYTSTTTVKVADLAEVRVPITFTAQLSEAGKPLSDPVEATGTVLLGVPSNLTKPAANEPADPTTVLPAPVPAQFGVESVRNRPAQPEETFFDQVEAMLIADGLGDLVRVGAPGRGTIQQLFSAANFSGNLAKMVVTDPDNRHDGWIRSGSLPRAAEKGWRRYFPGRSRQIEVRLVARRLDEVESVAEASHVDTSALSGESTDTNAAKRLWSVWGSVGGGLDVAPLSLVIAPRLGGSHERGFTQSIVEQTGDKQILKATAPGVRYQGEYGVQVRVLGRRPTMLAGLVETFQWTTRDRVRDTALDPRARERAEQWHGRTGRARTHFAPNRIERGDSFGGAFITRLGDGGLYDAVADTVRSLPGNDDFRLPSPDELLRHFDDPEFAGGLSPDVQAALARDAETRTQLSPEQLRHLANRIVGPGLKIPLVRKGTFLDYTTVVTIKGTLNSLSDGDVIDRGTSEASDKKRSKTTVTGVTDTSKSVDLSLETRVLGPIGRAASTLLGGPRAGVTWGDTDEHGLTGGQAAESSHGPSLDEKGKPAGVPLREFAGSLDLSISTQTYVRANQAGRSLSVGSYGRGVPTVIGAMQQAPRTSRLDVRMLIPESKVSQTRPDLRPSPLPRDRERIEHPLPIGMMTGGYPHDLDGRRVESFVGADRLQDAVIETLDEAGDDAIYTFEDGRISTVIADELSPERLAGDAELFSRPLTLSNLWHGRRAEDASGDVRVRLRPTNPKVLEETEFSRIKRTFAGGSSSKSKHGRSIELSASVSGTAVARGPRADHGDSTTTPGAAVTLSVTPWRRVWGKVQEKSLAGVSKLRISGRPERELLVQVDVDAEIIAEARHDSNMPLRLWPASPTSRAGQRLTLPGAVIMRMTPSELKAMQDRDRMRNHQFSDVRLQLQHAERSEALRAAHLEQRTRLSQAQARESGTLMRRQRAETNNLHGYAARIDRDLVGRTFTEQSTRHQREQDRLTTEHTEATQHLHDVQRLERDVLTAHQQTERDLVRNEQERQNRDAAATNVPAHAAQPQFRPGPQRSLGIGGVATHVDLGKRIPHLRHRLAEATTEELAHAILPVELGRSAYDNVRAISGSSFIGAANLHLSSALNGGRTETVRMERRFGGSAYQVTLTAEPMQESRFTGITMVDELSITDRSTIGSSETSSSSRTVGAVTVSARGQGTETDKVAGDAANTTGPGATSTTVGGGLTATAALDERGAKETRGGDHTFEQSLTVSGPVPTYRGKVRFTVTVTGPGLPPTGVSVQDIHEVTSLSASEGRPLATSDPVTSIPVSQTSEVSRRLWREADGFDRLPEPGRFAVEDVLVDLPSLHEAAAQALTDSGAEVDAETRAAIRNALTVTQAKALPAMQGGVMQLPMPTSLGRDLHLDARLVAKPKPLRADAGVTIGGSAKRSRETKAEQTAGHSFTLRMNGPMVTSGANHPGGASKVGERETFNSVTGTTFMEQQLYRTDPSDVVKDENKIESVKATAKATEQADDDNKVTQALEYGVEFRFVATSQDKLGKHRAGTEVRVPGGYVIRMDDAAATARTGREVPAEQRATALAVADATKTWTTAAATLDGVDSRGDDRADAERAYDDAENAWWDAYQAHEAEVAKPAGTTEPRELSLDEVVTVPLLNARGELVGTGFPSRDGDATTMPRFASAVDDADLGTYRRFEEGPGSGHTDEATPWKGRPVYFDVHGSRDGFAVQLRDGSQVSLTGTQFARLAAQSTALRDARNGTRSPVVLLSCDVAALSEQGGPAFDFSAQLRDNHLGETYASTTRTYTNPIGQGQVHLAVGDGGRFVRFGDTPGKRVGFAAPAPETARPKGPADSPENVWTDRAQPSVPPDPRLPIATNLSLRDVIHDTRRDRYGDPLGVFFPLDMPTDRMMRRAADFSYDSTYSVPNPYYPGTFDRVPTPWAGFTIPPRTVNAVSGGTGYAVIRLQNQRLVQVSGADLARLAIEAGLYDGPDGPESSVVLWGGFQGRDQFPGGLAHDFAEYAYRQAGREAPVFAADAMTDFTTFSSMVLPQGGSFQRFRPAAMDFEIESVTATSVVSDSPSDDTVVPDAYTTPAEPTPPSRVVADASGTPVVFSTVTDPQLSREVTAFAGDLRDSGIRHVVLETSLGGGQVDRQMLGSPWGADAHREAGKPVPVFLQRSADGTGFSISSPDGTPRVVQPRDLARHLNADPAFRSLDRSGFNRPLVLVVLGPNGGLTQAEADAVLEGQIEAGGYRRIFYPRGAGVAVRVGVRPSHGTVLTVSEGAFGLARPPLLSDVEVSGLPGDRGVRLPSGQPGDTTADAAVHTGARDGKDFGIAVDGDGTRVRVKPPGGRTVELTGSELGLMLADHPAVSRVVATEPDTGFVLLSPDAGRVDLPGNVGRDLADALPIDPEIRAVWAIPGDVRWPASGRLDVSGAGRPVRMAAGRFGGDSGTTDFDARPSYSAPPPPVAPQPAAPAVTPVVPFEARQLRDRDGTTVAYSAVTGDRHAEVAAFTRSQRAGGLNSYLRDNRLVGAAWSLNADRPGGRPITVFVERSADGRDFLVPDPDGNTRRVAAADLMRTLHRETGLPAIDDAAWASPIVLVVLGSPAGLTDREITDITAGQSEEGYRPIYAPTGDRARITLTSGSSMQLTGGEFTLLAEPARPDLVMHPLPGGRGLAMPLHRHVGDMVPMAMVSGTDRGNAPFSIAVNGDGVRVWVMTHGNRKLEMTGSDFGQLLAQHPALRKALRNDPSLRVLLASPESSRTGLGRHFAQGLGLAPSHQVLGLPGPVFWDENGHLDDDPELAPVPVDGSTATPTPPRPATPPAPAPAPTVDTVPSPEPDSVPFSGDSQDLLPPLELRDSTGRVFGISYAQSRTVRDQVAAWARSQPVEALGKVDTYDAEIGAGTPSRHTAGWAPSRGRRPFVVHFDQSDGVEAYAPTVGGDSRTLSADDIITRINDTGLFDVRGAGTDASLVLLSPFPGSHTTPGNLGHDLMAAAQRRYGYRGDLYAPQTAPSFTGGKLALDFGGDFAHFFAGPAGMSFDDDASDSDSAAPAPAPKPDPEPEQADEEAELRASREMHDEEVMFDPPLRTPADFQDPLQGKPPAPPKSRIAEARPVLDPLGEVFGISLLSKSEDRDRLRQFAEDTSYFALDMVHSTVDGKDKARAAPWARDSKREGGRPLFVFARNGFNSQEIELPRRDGTDDRIHPRDLARELARNPDWQKVDSGPFNRPIVLVLIGAMGAPVPKQVAEDVLDGMIATSGYRKVYYAAGQSWLPKNKTASYLYLDNGNYELVRGPRASDLTVEALPDGRGVVLPLPGDAADVAPAVRSSSATAHGGTFLVGVAGDGHRIWAATGNGGRRVELDGDTFAKALAQHPDVSPALAKPPAGGIKLVSPLAGARNEADSAGYDFANGLGVDTSDVRVTATVGVLPASGPSQRMAEVKFEDVRAISLTSKQSYTGPVGAFFPSPNDYQYILPTETDQWLERVSDYSMESWADESGFVSDKKTPWGTALPAVLKLGSTDNQTIALRDENDSERKITIAPGDVGRLALASKAFLEAAAEDNGHLITSASATGANLREILVLLPAGFSETAAAQVADSVRDDMRRHGFYRTVHTAVGTRMTEFGRLTLPTWMRTDRPSPLTPRDVEMRPLYYADRQLAGVSLPASLDDPGLDRQFVFNTLPGGPLKYTSYIGESSSGAPEYDLRRKDEKWDALILTHGMKAAFWIRMRNGNRPDRFGVNGDVLADLLNNGRYLAKFTPDKFRGYLGVVCHIGNEPWPDGPASAFGRRLHELGDKRGITAGSDTVSMGFVHGTLGVYRSGVYTAFPPAGVVHPTDPSGPGILPSLPPTTRTGPAPDNQNGTAPAPEPETPAVRWRDGLKMSELRVVAYVDATGRINGYGFPIGDDMAQRFRSNARGAEATTYESYSGGFGVGRVQTRQVPWAGQQPHFSLFVPPTRNDAGVRVMHRKDGIIEIPREQLSAIMVRGGLFKLPGVTRYTPIVVWTSAANADPSAGPVQEIGDALRTLGHRGQVFGPTTDLRMSRTGAALSGGGRMRAYGDAPGDDAINGPESVIMPQVTATDDDTEQVYPWREDAAFRPTPEPTPEPSPETTPEPTPVATPVQSDDESDSDDDAGHTGPQADESDSDSDDDAGDDDAAEESDSDDDQPTYQDEPPAQSINYNPPRPQTPPQDDSDDSDDESDDSGSESDDESDDDQPTPQPAAQPVYQDEPPAQSINYNPPRPQTPPQDDSDDSSESESESDESEDEATPQPAAQPVYQDEPPAQSVNYNPLPSQAPTPDEDDVIVVIEESESEPEPEPEPEPAPEPEPVVTQVPYSIVTLVDRHGRTFGFGMPYAGRTNDDVQADVSRINSGKHSSYARLDRHGQMTTSKTTPWGGRDMARPFWVDTRNLLRDSDPDLNVVANSASGAKVADLLINTVPELTGADQRKPMVLLVGNMGHKDDDPTAPARRFIRRLRELGYLGTVYGPTGDLRFKPESRYAENWLRIQDGRFVRLEKEPAPPRRTRR